MPRALGYAFQHASGDRLGSCDLLGHRFDAERGFSPEASDSWVLRFTTEGCVTPMVTRSWLTCLWRSPSGTLYVSDVAGRVYVLPPLGRGTGHLTHTLSGSLTAVWGIDDEFVLAWGLRAGTSVMFQWDGAVWSEMPSPGFVGAVHGPRRDLLFCAGTGGRIARWDGAAWHEVPSPTQSTLASVFVVGEDEAWACGPRGDILAGSVGGWARVLQHPTEGFFAIARWRDTVWVGATGALGLSRLEDGELASVKPKLHATRFDTRGGLLSSCGDRVVESADGVSFRSTTTEYFQTLTANEPVDW